MLNVEIQDKGFEDFITKLTRLSEGGLVSSGTEKFVNRVREIVIEGTPIGDSRDPHPGKMKQSWQQPVYTKSNRDVVATITNSVDYGVAENYGHNQVPGTYVPAINARLIHEWVPGTYALETSLDKAGIEFTSVIKPEILKVWNEDSGVGNYTVRQTFYDNPGGELID